MEPKHPNKEIFQKFVYASLIDKGYQRTAEEFRNDTQLTEPMPDQPPGFLIDFWNSFYEQYNSRARLLMEQTSRQNQVIVQQPSNTSTQSQVLGQPPSNTSTQSQVFVQQPLDTATAQRIWDEAPIHHHSSFGSGAELSSSDISSDGKMVASGGHAHRGTVGSLDLQREIEIPKRFDLSPSMKDLLKRSVRILAADIRLQLQAKGNLPGCSVMSNLESPVVSGANVKVDPCGHSPFPDNQDAVNSVLSKYSDLNYESLEFATEDQKDEVIASMVDQIEDLEKQAKERKEWAHQIALQAAKRLSGDMIELKTLRMEIDETQELTDSEQELVETTMKKLSILDALLRLADDDMDIASDALESLETENAEIRAEIEASKLSASESETACLEVAKKEKQISKKVVAWEKQKAKLQKEVSNIKEKISEAQQEFAQTLQRQNEAEVKWKEELKAQEDALALVEEERRAKDTAESNNKRGLEALRRKINIEFQRHKDYIGKLEHDLSHLKASAVLHHQSNTSSISDLDEANSNRECIICMKDEVSVVFLPCAHQVMCAKCSAEYGKKGKASCPCCQVQIQKRICTFGGS